MAKSEYVKLWLSYKDYFEHYSAAEVGRLVLAMMDYRASGAEPEFSGSERFVWPAIRRDIDNSVEALETAKDNGKKGGRPKKEETKQNPTKPNETPNNQGYGKGKGKGKGNGNGNGDNPPITPLKTDTRHKYGSYSNVLLSDEELDKLKIEFPTDWEQRIERLSEYIASKGAKYKSHLATIRAWARKDVDQTKQRQSQPQSGGDRLLEMIRGGVFDE